MKRKEPLTAAPIGLTVRLPGRTEKSDKPTMAPIFPTPWILSYMSVLMAIATFSVTLRTAQP